MGTTGGGTTLPLPDLIRLAGRANHWLAVFDGATGHALDLFRAKRTATAAQRLMLIGRDGGCTKPSCPVPAYGTQVHHARADWADGGNTNVDDLALACGPDNRLVDKNGGWRTTINDCGDVEWHPHPTWTPAKPASTTTTAPNYSCAHQKNQTKTPNVDHRERPASRAWSWSMAQSGRSVDRLGGEPRQPLPHFGWGTIPDQYGRESAKMTTRRPTHSCATSLHSSTGDEGDRHGSRIACR